MNVAVPKAKNELKIEFTGNETEAGVISDLTLPLLIEGFKGVSISWESDKPGVVSVDGVVIRQEAADTVVTLTATLTLDGKKLTKDFVITVLKAEVIVNLNDAKAALQVGLGSNEKIDEVISNLTLPTAITGFQGVTVTWTSDKPEVISNAGVVTRPENDTEVNLSAEIKLGEQTLYAIFKVTVLKAVDTKALKTLLDEHYKESLAIANFEVLTESIELVKKIGDFDVTWISNNTEVINPETGVVTRPAYAGVGEVFVVLGARSEGQDNVNYVVKVPELAETLESQLDKELARLTNFPPGYFPILSNDIPLDTLESVMVNGEEVAKATWTSSDPEYIGHDGALKEIEFAGEKDVVFTVTFTYQDITKTKSVTFTIKGITIYQNFTELIVGENMAKHGDVVIVRNVSFYSNTNDGYFLIDVDGYLLFRFGATPAVTPGKLYDVKGLYNLYYASPQIAGTPTFTEVEGPANTTPKIVEISIEELTKKPVPTDASPLVIPIYKVTGAKVHVFDIKDNYKTFLVPQTHNDPTKEPNKSDSMMLYYQTLGGLTVIQALADGSKTYSADLEYILVVVSAFRTNNDIYAFQFLGKTDDETLIGMKLSAEEEANLVLRNAAAKMQDQIYFDGQDFVVSNLENYRGKEYQIEVTSSDVAVVGHDGVYPSFPALGTVKEVVMTFKTTSTEGKLVQYEKTIKLGRTVTTISTIDEAVKLKKGDAVVFEALFHILINGTAQFVDGSNEGAAVRFAKGVDVSGLIPNTKYIVLATKADEYSGLKQFDGIAYSDIDGGTPIVPVKYTGALSNTELAKLMNNIIAVEDLTVSVAPAVSSTGVLTYTLKNSAGDSMAFREHQTNAAAIDAVLALELKVGDKVNVTSVVVSWFNSPQFINGFLERITLDPAVEFANSVTRLEATLPETDTVKYGDFNLPTTFENLAIVWTVTDGAAAASVEAGKVTITKLTDRTTVKLSGAVTQGEYQATVTVQLVIAKEGEEEPLPTIAEVFALPKDTEVVFAGVVSGFSPYNTKYNSFDKVWVEDETGSITLYGAKLPTTLAIGDKYIVTGKLAGYNGLIQIANTATFELVSSNNPLKDSRNITAISQLSETDQASRINLSGIVESITADGRTLKIVVGETTIEVRAGQSDKTHPVNAAILEGIVGQTVNLLNIHVDWYNGPQLFPTLASQIELVKLDDDEIVHMAIAQLIEQFKDKSFEMETAIVLPQELLGVSLVWTIDPTNAIVAGKWMTVTEDTNITLSVVGTLNEEVHSSGNMTVTIKFKKETAGDEEVTTKLYYEGETAKFTEDATQNNAAVVNLDASLFFVTGTVIQGSSYTNPVGLNKDGTIRLYSNRTDGGGNKLKIKILDGYVNNSPFMGLLVLGEEELNLIASDIANTVLLKENLDINEFSLTNNQLDGEKATQIWINYIEITYVKN